MPSPTTATEELTEAPVEAPDPVVAAIDSGIIRYTGQNITGTGSVRDTVADIRAVLGDSEAHDVADGILAALAATVDGEDHTGTRVVIDLLLDTRQAVAA